MKKQVTYEAPTRPRRVRRGLLRRATFLVIATFLLGAGCELLEVSNPNSLTEEETQQPTSANGLKNGVLNALMVATSWTYAPLSTISDEMYWSGSYESFGNYDMGRISNINNEITVNTFPELAEARWLADNAITLIEGFEAEGTLADSSILTKVHLYSALTRITIGDAFEDFVYSDKEEAAPPIGPEQMGGVYDEAVAHATAALARARASGHTVLEMQALGVRARALHAKGVWQKLNPPEGAPANPLVGGTGAADDAKAALALMPADYEATFDYQAALVANYLAQQTNVRGEVSIAEPFDDLLTGAPDPRAAAARARFLDTESYTENYSPLTWLSAAEMHLIVAESALADGDSGAARDALDTVRALADLPPVGAEDDLIAVLEHERRANLFLQGRRLNDMYRFGSVAENWLPDEDARVAPGTLLPIPSNEIIANPNL